MEEKYEEFLGALQKRGSKPHRIPHCLGSRDAWKWVRKNKWKALGGKPCEQSMYEEIIRTMNQILAEKLLEGHEVVLPYQMGSLHISSSKPRVRVVNGKIETTYRTDWKKTLRLLYEDRDARDSHQRVRRVNNRVYILKYSKRGAVYKYRKSYSFRPNRSMMRRIGKLTESGGLRGGMN